MITIYLDQNHWINLYKILTGKSQSKVDSKIITRARTLLVSEVVCFPISFQNIVELARVGNQRKRTGLAQFMVEFSAGFVVPSPTIVVDSWFKYSIQALLGLVPNPRPGFVPTKGLFNAFHPEAREELRRMSARSKLPLEHIDYFPEVWISFLSFDDETNRRRAIEQITATNREHNKGMRERRARLKDEPEEMKLRAYYALLALDQLDRIQSICRTIGVDYYRLMHCGHEKATRLISQIPFFDVEARIHGVSEKQWDRQFEENDWYDISALSAAIPCCKYVFTEKYWTRLIQQTDIRETYDVGVYSNIEHLKEILDSAA